MKGNKVMKKLISHILLIALILGTIGIVPSFAVAYDQTAIDFVVSEGYWKGNMDPSAYATRAQAASVLANYLSDLNPAYTGIYSDVAATHMYADDIMLASSIGLVSGSGGAFRPDSNITREEFAVMLVRANEIAGVDLLESAYLTELMIDYDSISDWAKTSVCEALTNALMVSGEKKLFNPKGTVTVSELAIATHNLSVMAGDFKLSYKVRDVKSSDNITRDFSVVKTFSGFFTGGVSGAGMIAYFNGAPGEIYIKRYKTDLYVKKKNGEANNIKIRNNFGEPVCYARITDPNGNVVCYVDLDYKASGVMEKIVNIPEGPAGIYQIQFTQGAVCDTVEEQDRFTVGLKNPSSWGIRGEDEIVFVDGSIPTTGYLYIPEKVDHLNIGIGSVNKTDYVKLTDLSGNLLGEVSGYNGWTLTTADTTLNFSDSVSETVAAAISANGYYESKNTDKYGRNLNVTRYYSASRIPKGTVVKYELPSDYRGRLNILGVTPVIYESVEDALELKSGYVYHTDKYTGDGFLQLCGPLQVKARERMVEIYDEMGGAEGLALNVASLVPSSLPDVDTIDNPLAEAQAFSCYNHSISSMKPLIDKQCLDPSNPYFGIPKTTFPEKDFQTGHYGSYMKFPYTGLSLNSELNIYYNNEVLTRRSELATLFLIMQLPADNMIRNLPTENQALNGYLRGGETFFLGDGAGGFATSYSYVRNHYSPETRKITDQGVLNIIDKAMNITGQTPANQNLMAQVATVATYKWSGADRYHKNLKNHLMDFMHPAIKESGQGALGYFTEGFGADGSSYGKMSETLWHDIVYTYFSLPESMKDPELVAKIYEAEELYLVWDGYFILPNTENFATVRAANWTGRVNTGLGTGRMTGENGNVINYFPRAKKNWLVLTWGKDWEKNYKTGGEGNTAYTSHGPLSNAYVLTNNTWARSYIEYLYDNKAKMYVQDLGESYRASHSEMYYVHHQEQQFDDSEMPELPYEAEGGYNFFVDKNGIVTLKHNGFYLICHFNNANSQLSYYAWIGGGPTTLWDDYFATTVNARKPGNGAEYDFHTYNSNYYNAEYDIYDDWNVDHFYHSCILGTDENGRMFVSGRERTKFEWLEKNKSFRLKGTQSTTKTVGEEKITRSHVIVWDYAATETGIDIKGGVETFVTGQRLYMQLPIYVPTGATYSLDEENTKIVISHKGNSITYDWDEYNYEVKEAGNYKFLRIRLTKNSPQGKVSVSRNLAS